MRRLRLPLSSALELKMTDVLPPIDANGKPIKVGAVAKIPKIPDWLAHDLPTEDVALLRNTEGSHMAVTDIDKFGYVWFSDNYDTPWFCLKPSEIEILEVN